MDGSRAPGEDPLNHSTWAVVVVMYLHLDSCMLVGLGGEGKREGACTTSVLNVLALNFSLQLATFIVSFV